MAEEPLVIRGVDWRQTFAFTNIFRSFRVAIHPTKLILGLAAVLTIYFGGRLLDALWPASQRGVAVVQGGQTLSEVDLYQQFQRRQEGEGVSFAEVRSAARKQMERDYAKLLTDYGVYDKPDDAAKAAARREDLGKLEEKIADARKKRLDDAKKGHDDAMKLAREEKDSARRRDLEKATADGYQAAVKAAYAQALRDLKAARNIKGEGPFAAFLDYQVGQINGIVRGVYNVNFLGDVGPNLGEQGVFRSALNFVSIGPVWAIGQHWLYFVIWLAMFMVLFAIFGGAIARVAAVHVAREEKLSVRQALKFSLSKFWSFLSAPIIPLLIVLVVGIIVAAGGLLANIPFVGPILVGVLFFLAIGAGFVMTLVLFGTVGGFTLMYPTIAVEGSDSFDAISRSFSYVYARPWRMAFYSLVALVYGALTYVFVRAFVYVTLVLTRTFAGAWVFVDANNTDNAWSHMWPIPHFWHLPYDLDTTVLGSGQALGAGIMSIWIYLTIGLAGAFLLSLFISANTIIYYLMRREVDATELDDVYLEQPEEELAPAATGATAAAATATVAAAVPSAQPGETPPPAEAPPAAPPAPPAAPEAETKPPTT